MLIIGTGALRRKDGAAILAAARALAESAGMVRDGWNGFNVLHLAASRVGGLDLGFVPGQGGATLPASSTAWTKRRDRRASICSAPTRSTPRSSARRL